MYSRSELFPLSSLQASQTLELASTRFRAVKPPDIPPLDPCHYKPSLLARVSSHQTTHQSIDASASSVTRSSSQRVCYSSSSLPHGRSHTKAYSPVEGTEDVGNYSRVRSLNPSTKEIGNQVIQCFDGLYTVEYLLTPLFSAY